MSKYLTFHNLGIYFVLFKFNDIANRSFISVKSSLKIYSCILFNFDKICGNFLSRISKMHAIITSIPDFLLVSLVVAQVDVVGSFVHEDCRLNNLLKKAISFLKIFFTSATVARRLLRSSTRIARWHMFAPKTQFWYRYGKF
jgi:hypothetical protein